MAPTVNVKAKLYVELGGPRWLRPTFCSNDCNGPFSYPLPDTIAFSQRELARLVGRKSFGGSDQQDFYTAIQQLRSTRVSYWHYDKVTDAWSNRNIQILDTDIWSGREHQITRCSVQLHPSIVESLNNRHAMCLNYTRMEHLAPIGVALYKRLFFHFSNLYSLKRTKDFSYTKNYATICTTWLGGLKVLRYQSKIEHEQLGKHLKQINHHVSDCTTRSRAK